MPDEDDISLSQLHESLSQLHETVRGGERVLVRRVRPEDMALYPDFLADVSAEDLRLRFFARIAELSGAEIDRLGHIDYRYEMAFIALDEDTGQMLGLVRLIDELDEKTAEFAILVRSRLKGHGLGWLLMRRVIDYAKEKGLRRVYGDVLAENATMLQMCTELGFHMEDLGSNMRRALCSISKITPTNEYTRDAAVQRTRPQHARVASYAFTAAASFQMLFCRVSGIKNRPSTNAIAGTAIG